MAGISSTPGGFLKCSIPVRVCAEQSKKILANPISVSSKTADFMLIPKPLKWD
jgi:hypothetical protein